MSPLYKRYEGTVQNLFHKNSFLIAAETGSFGEKFSETIISWDTDTVQKVSEKKLGQQIDLYRSCGLSSSDVEELKSLYSFDDKKPI